MSMLEHWAENKIVHLCWVIGVLVFLLIRLISKDFGAIADLKDILSFAVSFTSLVLAIFAIGQATFASSSSAQIFASLLSASKNLEDVGARIEDASSKLPEATQGILSVSERIAGSAADIQSFYTTQVAPTTAEFPLPAPEDEKQRVAVDLQTTTNAGLVAFLLIFESYRHGKGFKINDFRRGSDAFSGLMYQDF